jgi:16S rRNA (guanine527-N7)-methyltransferase
VLRLNPGPSPFPWESAIAARARAAGLDLSDDSAGALAAHARAVLAANERLHLTTVLDPESFLERHIGESFEGAALIPAACAGVLVDLGSGNGYPGIPIAIARPGLAPVLIESSIKKSAFLREALRVARCERGTVREGNVARAADLGDSPPIDVLVTRAMGGWERIVPKLISRLAPAGIVLIWSTLDAEAILGRAAWKSLEIVTRRKLPGRDRSMIYRLAYRGNN